MQILKYFIQEFPDYVKKMKECSYHYKTSNLNLHHIEGDVWSHTVLSYKYALMYDMPSIIKWAIVLHDIGRIYTRRESKKNNSVSFGDFEGVSCAIAVEVLHKTTLSKDEKVNILKIISYHYEMIDYIKFNDPTLDELKQTFKYEENLLKDLALYVQCDLRGRIIDTSREYLYDFSKIDTLLLALKNVQVTIQNNTLKKFNAYILVGAPNSGKSTWIKNFKKDFYLVSKDAAVIETGAKYNKFNYDDAHDYVYDNKEIEKEVEALNLKHEKYALSGINQDIIFDNPNLKLKNRKEWIEPLHMSHNIISIVFLTPLKTLKKRNKQRKVEINKSIGTKTIIRKLKTFSFPLLGEGISKVEYVFSSDQ